MVDKSWVKPYLLPSLATSEAMRLRATPQLSTGPAGHASSARTTMRGALLTALWLLGCLAGTRTAIGQTVRVGGEFRVNTYTTSYQSHPRIARDSDGNFMVAWSSYRQDGSFTGVYAKKFDVNLGSGTAFKVNSYTSSYQDYPAVASDASGTFVVVWQSYRQDGSYNGVFGQRINAGGNPAGTEFRVNTTTQYDQSRPSVVKDGTGKYVVVWQDFNDGHVYGRRYDASGSAQGSPFRLNTYTSGFKGYPSIARDGNAAFVVVWNSYAQDGSDQGVYGQRFTNTGSKSGSEFRVNSYTTGMQMSPQVAQNSGGTFVVAWQSVQDGSGSGVFAQRYNSSGTKVGGEFQVNTYTLGEQVAPMIAIDGTGRFVVVWESVGQDGSLSGVYGQRYNADGTPHGVEFRVNSYTTSAQAAPAIALDNLGNFVVTWQSFSQDGSGDGVYAQKFTTADCSAPSVSAPSPSSATACEGGSAIFSVTASGLTPFTYQWMKGNTPLDDGPFISGSKTRTLSISNIMAIDAASYKCVATDYCLPGASVTSALATLNYNALQSVGKVDQLVMHKVNGGGSLRFTWGTATNAEDYVVVEDSESDGPFITVTGSASSGTSGLTIPMPAGTKFYLVAGRSDACGIGPKK